MSTLVAVEKHRSAGIRHRGGKVRDETECTRRTLRLSANCLRQERLFRFSGQKATASVLPNAIGDDNARDIGADPSAWR